MFNPGDVVSPYPESYLTLALRPQENDVALTLEHLPVLDRFVRLNALGWHSYLDMVEAGVRRPSRCNRAIPHGEEARHTHDAQRQALRHRP